MLEVKNLDDTWTKVQSGATFCKVSQYGHLDVYLDYTLEDGTTGIASPSQWRRVDA